MNELMNIAHIAVTNSMAAIILTDPTGVIEYINPAGEQMLGIDGDAATKEVRIQDFFLEKDKTDESFDALRSSRRWEGEITVRNNENRDLSIEVAAGPARGKDGFSGYVFSILDKTHRKGDGKERESSERDAATVEALATACHYISQPATVLLLNSEMLEHLAGTEQFEEMPPLLQQNTQAASELQKRMHTLNNITVCRTEQYLKKGTDNYALGNMMLNIDQEDWSNK